MKYKELKLLGEAFKALPEHLKNDELYFIIHGERVFTANHLHEPMQFVSGQWHKVPIISLKNLDNFNKIGEKG